MEATMQSTRENPQKRPYITPQLSLHGRLEDLTKGTNKDLGGVDGLTFQQQPVQWTS
jgi:hypothetical protein